MAQYSTDFSSQTVDAAPAGWTERYESASVAGRVMVREKETAIGGKVLRIEVHTANGHFVGATFDAVDADADRDDFEALAIFSITGAVSNTIVNVIGRAAGTLRTNAYFCGATLAAATGVFQKRAVKRVGGTGTTLQSSDYTLVLDRRMAIRTRASGTTVSAKIWEYDLESEPGTYDLSGSVSDVTSAGWVGFFVGAVLNSSSKGPVDLEYFSVGTNGDAAVAPASGSDPVAFSGTVPAQSFAQGSTITPLDLSSYFSGDMTPFSYAVTTGTLPTGLSLNASTGVISGTPTTAASAVSIVVTATDDDSNTAATNAFNITITAVDSTAPTLSSPTGVETGTTTASGTVSTNEANGTLYAVVTTSATPPSAAAIRAGTGAVYDTSQAVSATGVQTVSASGLTAATAYYWHFLHDDASANVSNIETSASFTTDAVATVVKGVQLALYARTGLTPRASVTGITARWWDSPTAAGAPLLKTDSASTNGSGVMTLDLDSVTSLSVAGLGYLVLYKAGAGADTDLHFAGRVAVSDIA